MPGHLDIITEHRYNIIKEARTMFLDDLILYNKISLYKLSEISHVPYTTLADIRSGKSNIQNCSVKVVKSISDALGLTINELLDYAEPFEIFRCNTLHLLKSNDEKEFLYRLLSERTIDYYFRIHCHAKCLYLLALVDFLCDKYDIDKITNYEFLRTLKLPEPLVSDDLLILKRTLTKENYNKMIEAAMPEFLKYNIVEDDLYNVV